MSDMKCPFCQQELLLSSYRDGDKDNEIWNCLHCQIGGKRKLWQELIRTRKALDVARNGLEYIFGYEGVPKYVVKHIRQVLDQIKNETALEQKD